MLPQGAGISVTLCTAGHLTRVRLLYTHGQMKTSKQTLKSHECGPAAHCFQMCALVLRSVAGVAEGLVAAWVLTQVGFLPSVAPKVDFQVL